METIKYNRTARFLHWISAAVIIWATLAGFFMATLEPQSATRGFLSWLNVSVTTLFTPVFVFRVAYASHKRKPMFLQMPAWQQTVAGAVHRLLYILTGIVLASGLLMMQHKISGFGIAMLPNPLNSAYWNAFFYDLHRYSCMALFLLVSLHVAAVIRHQRAGRNVLSRMI